MGLYKKAKKAGVKKAKARYYNKNKGRFKTGTIIKDAIKAYTMLNAEKKFVAQGITEIDLGQVDGNASGGRQYDVTPLLTQGTTANTRNGNSVKLTSSFFQFQIVGMVATISKIKLFVDFYLVKGTPLGAITNNGSSVPMTDIYDPTIFSGVIDGTSTRNQDHYSDYQLLRSHKCTLMNESLAGEINTMTFGIPMKYNRGKGHHVRYNGNTGTSTDLANGQIVMLLRADVGNRNSVSTSTQNIPIKGVSSGMLVRWSVKHWFYDN